MIAHSRRRRSRVIAGRAALIANPFLSQLIIAELINTKRPFFKGGAGQFFLIGASAGAGAAIAIVTRTSAEAECLVVVSTGQEMCWAAEGTSGAKFFRPRRNLSPNCNMG